MTAHPRRRPISPSGLSIARETGMDVDYVSFSLDQATEAWRAQAGSPHAKVIGTIVA